MEKPKNKIPQKKLVIFERIIQKYEGSNEKCEAKFREAREEHLTREQRFSRFEQKGSCQGTGSDKERKAFALENANKTIAERLDLFNKKFNRNGVLNADNTITIRFKCTHGYYKRVHEKKYTSQPPAIETYFERCAGERLYEYQKALGIKLKIKSVDISPLKENLANPVVFTLEIAE
jgi:hypothetical protein